MEARLSGLLPLRTGTLYRSLARLLDDGLIEEVAKRPLAAALHAYRRRSQTGFPTRTPAMTPESIRTDARLALRQFRRAPLFAVMVVATLAIGIGPTSAIFSPISRIKGMPPDIPSVYQTLLDDLGLD